MRKTIKIDESEYQKIGRRIKLLRVNNDLSQSELAKRLGIAQANLSCLEHGKTCPTLRRLIQIRDILGCSMKDFFEEETAKVAEEDDVTVEEIVEAMRIIKQIKLAEARED